MNDRDIAALITQSLGYKTTVGPTDRTKVEAEAEGIRKPYPSAKLAQAAVELYRRQPPLVVNPLAAPWRLDAVYTITLSNFPGPKRQAAWTAGYRAVYVQLLHALYAQANEAELPVFRNERWTPIGWGTYGQGSDPEEDGRKAAAIVKRLSLAGWKANGEAWAEGEHSWKTEAFLRGWKEGGSPAPLGWSVLSSDTANFARSYAYDVALSVAGADIDIQVYGATYPSYTVGAGLGMLAKAGVPVARTTMSFDVNAEGEGPFTDYRTWLGPRRVWTGDASRPTTFDQLAR